MSIWPTDESPCSFCFMNVKIWLSWRHYLYLLQKWPLIAKDVSKRAKRRFHLCIFGVSRGRFFLPITLNNVFYSSSVKVAQLTLAQDLFGKSMNNCLLFCVNRKLCFSVLIFSKVIVYYFHCLDCLERQR